MNRRTELVLERVLSIIIACHGKMLSGRISLTSIHNIRTWVRLLSKVSCKYFR